jgi:predicted MFS family arabinose efflux permease
MLWLPPHWLLLLGLFICATVFAPLLPVLEAAMLTAAHPAQRTLMLSALSTLVGLADVLGTVSMGALMSWSSSTAALGLCLGVACLAALACGVWPGRSRGRMSTR